MFKLNTKDGYLELSNWIFTPRDQLKDIEEKLPLEGLELWSSNFQWQSFRLTMVPGYILVVIQQFSSRDEMYFYFFNEYSQPQIMIRASQQLNQSDRVKIISFKWGN